MDWLRPRNFSRRERIGIAGFALAAAALSTLPYLVFFAQTPPEKIYTWASVFYYDDAFQYYAWARHIAHGDWLIRNYYTGSAAASYALFNPYFLLLGWATRISGNVYFASHLLRVVGIALFAWVSYAFIALFLKEVRLRRAAQLLMLGGGLEYPFYYLNPTRYPTPLADPYIFKILYRYGHLTFALCLLLIIFGTYVAALPPGIGKGKSAAFRRWIALFAATFALGLINPYYVVLAVSVLVCHTAWQIFRRDYHSIWLTSGAFTGGLAAYAQYRFQSLSSNLGAISFDDPINFADFVLFCVLLFVLAALGWQYVLREHPPESRSLDFLLVWAVLVFALVLSPLTFRARLVFGLSAVLAIPAAAWIGRRSFASPIYWPIYGLLLIEMGFTSYKESIDFSHKGIGQINRAMVSAMQSLEQNAGESDLVVSLADTSNFIPAYTLANVYVGHSFQTENYYEKRNEVVSFFRDWSGAERLEFLNRIGARFVFMGPDESKLDPRFELPRWEKIYEDSGYTIYARGSP